MFFRAWHSIYNAEGRFRTFDQPHLHKEFSSRAVQTLTYLALSASGLSTHVRQEGDVVHLDETLIDLGLVGEDVKTGRVELYGKCSLVSIREETYHRD